MHVYGRGGSRHVWLGGPNFGSERTPFWTTIKSTQNTRYSQKHWMMMMVDLWRWWVKWIRDSSLDFSRRSSCHWIWLGDRKRLSAELSPCRPAEQAETTMCFLICDRQSPLARQILLCEQRRTDHRRVPKNNYIFDYPRNLVWWKNATRFH